MALVKEFDELMNKTCEDCIWHRVHWDEINGKFYHDGCLCMRQEKGTHIASCGTKKECPVWEAKDEHM